MSQAQPGVVMVSLSEAYAIAIGHHRAGRMGEAAGVYRAILDADPRQADALHLLGVLSGQTGRSEEAVSLIAQAIAQDPEAADYHDNLGSLRRGGGDAMRAAAHHARALALEPARAKATFNRGLALGDLGRMGEALGCFRAALRIDPGYGAAALAAGRLLSGGPESGVIRGAAERWLAHALSLAPDSADGWAAVGRARLAAGEADGAMTGYGRAARLRPDDGAALSNLAMATLQASGALPEFPRADRPEASWGEPLARALDLFLAALERGAGEVAEVALFRTAVLTIHRGMLDDARLERIAERARDRLRRAAGDGAAAACIAHGLYRRGRLVTASRLARRYLRGWSEEAIRADPQAVKWRPVDARPVFLEALAGYRPRIAEAGERSMPVPPAAEGGAILLVSVDSGYWRRFGGWFLSHALKEEPGDRVHVHIVNPGAEDRADLDRRCATQPGRLSWSLERIDLSVHAPGAETTYYACARFFVALDLLERAGAPVFITDIDACCTAPLPPDLRDGAGWDLTIMRDRRARGPFDDIIVSFLGIAPTAAGREFLGLVRAYIGWFFDRGEAAWTLDQAAPYAILHDWMRRGRTPRLREYEFLRLPWFDFPVKGEG
ncbi:tetratricopeptide repeat protein [Azospirillum aestuarii]|uniref:tetratricopeptide repeat protein n=1 Tax=Azospirillum aestuarii TaxID=2802052 RepID=UPI0040551EBC